MATQSDQVARKEETVHEIALDLVQKLKTAGQTLGVAESLTAGGVMATITSVPGASAVFRGGVVSYATALKEQLLDVDKDLIAAEGVIHGEVAKQMAQGARQITKCDGKPTTWGIGTTGVAGPASQDNKPVGTVYIGLASPTKAHAVGPFSFGGTREDIRQATIHAAIRHLRDLVSNELGGGSTSSSVE